jgi:hypothetical protein
LQISGASRRENADLCLPPMSEVQLNHFQSCRFILREASRSLSSGADSRDPLAWSSEFVMPGLVQSSKEDVDGRVEPGHDEKPDRRAFRLELNRQA